LNAPTASLIGSNVNVMNSTSNIVIEKKRGCNRMNCDSIPYTNITSVMHSQLLEKRKKKKKKERCSSFMTTGITPRKQ